MLAHGIPAIEDHRPGAPLCGASVQAELPGETYQQAWDRVDARYDGLELARVFYPGPPGNWPGKLNVGSRPMHVSFKAAPAEILAGHHDGYLPPGVGSPGSRTKRPTPG